MNGRFSAHWKCYRPPAAPVTIRQDAPSSNANLPVG